MRTIILSYDYEIFFGDKSGTIEKTLIVPTNFLLNKMDELEIKGNFFIDYLMLKYLRKVDTERTNRDIQLIETQIKDIVRRGHRIELHLHPHWIDAQYNGDGTWNFQANIKIDSSISYGAYGKNQYSYFDFLDAPNKVMYRFEDDVCNEVADGRFCEIPISSFHRTIFYRIIDKVHRILSKRLSPIADGSHRRQDLKYVKRKNNIAMMTLSKISPISVILSSLLSKKEMLVFIDHPKDFTFSSLCSIRFLSYFFNTTTYYNECQ